MIKRLAAFRTLAGICFVRRQGLPLGGRSHIYLPHSNGPWGQKLTYITNYLKQIQKRNQGVLIGNCRAAGLAIWWSPPTRMKTNRRRLRVFETNRRLINGATAGIVVLHLVGTTSIPYQVLRT